MIVSRSSGGGGGGGTVLFNSTLAVDTAAIDTGAGGIATTSTILVVYMLLRSDEAATASNIDITVNNDGAAVYDKETVNGVNVAASAANVAAANFWLLGIDGANALAGYATPLQIAIPFYASTAFFKTGIASVARPDSAAANAAITVATLGYRATTAISRLKVTAEGAVKLKAGSQLLCMGF